MPRARRSEEEPTSYFVLEPMIASARAHTGEEPTSCFIPRRLDPQLLDAAPAPFLGGGTPGSLTLPPAPAPRCWLLQVSPLVVNA
jgi:hypothetical protein